MVGMKDFFQPGSRQKFDVHRPNPLRVEVPKDGGRWIFWGKQNDNFNFQPAAH